MTTFVKPDLPGTKITFVGDEITTVAPSFAEVVAVPIVHDWGPLGSESEGTRLVTSFAQFEATYGTGDTPGRTAVLGAFQGMGLNGARGAGGVLVHRMATGAAAKATRALSNTTPAVAITLTALHNGDRGEEISVTVTDDPVTAGSDRLQVWFRGAVVESYTYAQTDIAALVTLINARPSRYVTAALGITGVALAAQAAPLALQNGNNGDVVTATEWLAALDALEFQDFGIFAPYNLTDSSIQASVLSWLRSQETEQRPIRAVFGGAAGEVLATAVTRSTALADPHVINIGIGTWHDDLVDADLSTAQLAPRVAGVLAARGQGSALTRAPLAGLTPVGSTGPSIAELVAARDGGVTAFRRVSDPDTEVAISQGVTTFTSRVTAARPYDIFSEPRMVGIMDNYVRRMREWGDKNLVGITNVTDDSRASVRQQGRALSDELEGDGLIEPGSAFISVVDPEDPGLADAIPYDFGWQFTRTTNYLLGQGRVR